MQRICRNPPLGALRDAGGRVTWRVWTPLHAAPSLVSFASGQRQETAMTPEGNGYFTCGLSGVKEGDRYAFRLADDRDYPDPAARWQPDGVHGLSAVFFPESHQWSDATWRGLALDDLVIYELHVGTFTPQGTFDAIVPRLPQLRSLGVTAIELMPVAQFAGQRNWGYDGVCLYAVQNSYGGPRGLQRLVDAAHRAGLAVILDVVYNHLGPEGNYLASYGPYVTDRYHTPWGMAINYDGPDSDAVRAYVIDNARMWVRDYHVDGLRLDAVHAVYDVSPHHILSDIHAAVQREATDAGRLVHVIAESDQNDIRLIRSRERGGYGLDGAWNDDFHHSVHAILTGERDGYYADFGEPSHLVKAMNNVFVYDGCYSPFRRRRHGTRVGTAGRSRFVVFVQNHDQIGNRARGDRLTTIVSPAAQRLACGLLLVSPYVPLLFMGEEYGETRPFPFFCSFGDPGIVEAVRQGRRKEFADLAFRWGIDIPDPQSPDTFDLAKLDWSWPEDSARSQLRLLYQDLLAARRQWPALRDRRRTHARLINDPASREPVVLVVQRGGDRGLAAVANLTMRTVSTAELQLDVGPVLLSTEEPRYGGSRSPTIAFDQILPHELIVFDLSRGQP
jgi:maltooligosyltrehalose trehalohydrolase